MRMLRLHQVIDQVGLSRSTIYDEMLRGGFPRQVKLGRRAVAWSADEVEAWVEARKAARDAA